MKKIFIPVVQLVNLRKSGIFIISLLIFMLSISCSTTSVHKYGIIDPTEKTVSMDPGGDNFTGRIKEAMIEKGWNIIVNDPTSIINESVGEKEISNVISKTRYKLKSDYKLFFNWSADDSLQFYDLSFIDTKTGNEIFTYSGSATFFSVIPVQNVVSGFIKELESLMIKQ